MRSTWKSVVALAALIGGVWLGVKPASAKAEYSKKEKKSCTFCQVAMGNPDLNDTGKYWKEHDHSLEGYQPNE